MYLLKTCREQILTVPMYSDGPEAPTSSPKLWANIPPKTSIPRLSQAELGTRIQNLIQIDNRVWVTNFTTPHSQSCPWSPGDKWVEGGRWQGTEVEMVTILKCVWCETQTVKTSFLQQYWVLEIRLFFRLEKDAKIYFFSNLDTWSIIMDLWWQLRLQKNYLFFIFI